MLSSLSPLAVRLGAIAGLGCLWQARPVHHISLRRTCRMAQVAPGGHRSPTSTHLCGSAGSARCPPGAGKRHPPTGGIWSTAKTKDFSWEKDANRKGPGLWPNPLEASQPRSSLPCLLSALGNSPSPFLEQVPPLLFSALLWRQRNIISGRSCVKGGFVPRHPAWEGGQTLDTRSLQLGFAA